MHWTQIIRERLDLSQEELALYLQLSVHTINSVELDRRPLPEDSALVALALFNAVKDQPSRPIEHLLLVTSHLEHRTMVKRHRRCCRKLEARNRKLERMQKIYTDMCARLGSYQVLIHSLASSRSNEDVARLEWAELKIREAILQIEKNNINAQRLLKAEIAGLQGTRRELEKDLRNQLFEIA